MWRHCRRNCSQCLLPKWRRVEICVCPPKTGSCWGPERTCRFGHLVVAPPVTAGVAAVVAGLARPTSYRGEDTGLLLLLQVPAGNMSCQAEAEPAVAELSTFQDYLGKTVVVTAVTFAVVRFLLRLLLLDCLLVHQLDLHGRYFGSDEGSG